MTQEKQGDKPKTFKALFETMNGGKIETGLIEETIVKAAMVGAMEAIQNDAFDDDNDYHVIVLVMGRLIGQLVHKGQCLELQLEEAAREHERVRDELARKLMGDEANMEGMRTTAEGLRRELTELRATNEQQAATIQAEVACVAELRDQVVAVQSQLQLISGAIRPQSEPATKAMPRSAVIVPPATPIVTDEGHTFPSDPAVQPLLSTERIPLKVQALRAAHPNAKVDGHPPLDAGAPNPAATDDEEDAESATEKYPPGAGFMGVLIPRTSEERALAEREDLGMDDRPTPAGSTWELTSKVDASSPDHPPE